jgi:hypothetical protein
VGGAAAVDWRTLLVVGCRLRTMCKRMYVYVYVYVCVRMYIQRSGETERQRDRERRSQTFKYYIICTGQVDGCEEDAGGKETDRSGREESCWW